MFRLVKKPKKLVCSVSFLLNKDHRVLNYVERPFTILLNYSSHTTLNSAVQSTHFLVRENSFSLISLRNKHHKKRTRFAKHDDDESSDDDLDEDEEEEEEDLHVTDGFVEKGAQIKTNLVNSLRIDLIVKSALGISRKKIEDAFYDNKIRVNGKIIFKKSQNVQEGDEIDLIKKINDTSLNTLQVARVKILHLESQQDTGKIQIKTWSAKSLVINNYPDGDMWKEYEVKT